MPIIVVSILIQLCLVIHIIKTGKNTTWIWVIVILPLVGSLAYIILEILPDITNSRSGRQAGKRLQSVINPNKDLNEAAKDFSTSNTVENSMRLANECFGKGLFDEAKALYQKSLRGVHTDDPELMHGLAKCEFELGGFLAAKNILDDLIDKNPDFKNQGAHLLYARSLERIGDDISAEHEYQTLYNYASGPEASYYYAKYLQSKGQHELAREIFSEIVQKAKNSGRHYNDLYGEVIKKSKNEISS